MGADGSRIQTNADGSKLEVRADGTRYKHLPDGSILKLGEDGSIASIEKPPDAPATPGGGRGGGASDEEMRALREQVGALEGQLGEVEEQNEALRSSAQEHSESDGRLASSVRQLQTDLETFKRRAEAAEVRVGAAEQRELELQEQSKANITTAKNAAQGMMESLEAEINALKASQVREDSDERI